MVPARTQMVGRDRSRRGQVRAMVIVASLAAVLGGTAPARAATGSLSGVMYQDLDRDAVRDAGESGFADHSLFLFDAAGSYVATSTTDASGAFSFGARAEGSYTIRSAPASWWSIREDWVPSGTGSLEAVFPVQVVGATSATIGWRPIITSSDVSAPIDSFTGPNGLRVQAYNDVVPARTVYDALMEGAVGEEASTVTVRFAYGSGSSATTSYTSTGGTYANYRATVYVGYTRWLDSGLNILSHEYGHAWTMYHGAITQQDPSLAAYLEARGLAGDPRVNSSYEWNVRELIAEDYRQLLGPPSARSAPQTNRDIPRAADVPGLADFLRYDFTTPAPVAEPTPEPTPDPTPTAEPSPDPTPTKGNGGGKGGGGADGGGKGGGKKTR